MFALRPHDLSRAPSAGVVSNATDLYNSATGTWSTAQLSVAREILAVASVGNVALFAGGDTGSALLCREGGDGVLMVACVSSVCACCVVAVMFALRPLAFSRAPLQVVLPLILWTCTTVQQGHGRRLSSAWRAIGLQLRLLGTWLCSLGDPQEVRCCAGRGWGWSVDGCVRVECLRVLQSCGSVCPATACCLTRATADNSNIVDLYNSATGTWSTAQLSVARGNLAAASVGNVALFAGGSTGGALLCREGGGSEC
jgi:hypothetical protein